MPDSQTEQALRKVARLEGMRSLIDDPGKWMANLEDADFGETITIEAEGAQIAHVLNVEEFCCIGDEPGEQEAVDAQARAIAQEIAELRNSSPALLGLVRALLEEREAESGATGVDEEATHVERQRIFDARAAADAALSRFVAEGGGGE